MDFKEIIKSLDEYPVLLNIYGERLFIMRDGEYEVLAVRLAHRIHRMATMTHMVIEGDGVLKPDGSLLNKGLIVASDSYTPIKSR